eukprot:351486-Chlamydomonas_euryale.AAC.13
MHQPHSSKPAATLGESDLKLAVGSAPCDDELTCRRCAPRRACLASGERASQAGRAGVCNCSDRVRARAVRCL